MSQLLENMPFDEGNEDTGKFNEDSRKSGGGSAKLKKREAKAARKEKKVGFRQDEEHDSILDESDNESKNVVPESAISRDSKKTRGLGKKTLSKIESMAKDPALTVLKKRSATTAKVTCKCARSGCLKMYCECFTMGRFCDESCNCKNC